MSIPPIGRRALAGITEQLEEARHALFGRRVVAAAGANIWIFANAHYGVKTEVVPCAPAVVSSPRGGQISTMHYLYTLNITTVSLLARVPI